MSVDRLALVSKVLLDVRFLELKRENERLKLSLFWVDHGISVLRRFMGFANNRASGPRCRCSGCMRARRSRPTILDRYDDEETEQACRFGPWFEKMLQEHGMTFACSGRDGKHFPCEADREHYPMPEVNVHFLIFASEDESASAWCTWVYGAKLWKAQTTEDAELVKLAALFKSMRHDPDWGGLDFDQSDSDS
jgi:hypothetical protein